MAAATRRDVVSAVLRVPAIAPVNQKLHRDVIHHRADPAAAVTLTACVVIFLTEPHVQSRTLAHGATVRLAIRRERWITRRPDVQGYEGQVEIVKHKLGRAGAVTPIRIIFNGTVRGEGL